MHNLSTSGFRAAFCCRANFVHVARVQTIGQIVHVVLRRFIALCILEIAIDLTLRGGHAGNVIGRIRFLLFERVLRVRIAVLKRNGEFIAARRFSHKRVVRLADVFPSGNVLLEIIL